MDVQELIHKAKKKYHHMTLNNGHVLVLTRKKGSVCKRNIIDMITIKPYADIAMQCGRYSDETLKIASEKLRAYLNIR